MNDFVGESPQKAESRKDILQEAGTWLENHVREALSNRQDGEQQLDHLVAVGDNTRKILRAEQGAPLSAEQFDFATCNKPMIL
jgi:hypothetical protein